MASITYWNRVEPRPRSRSIQRSLMAQVRDPLWFLTRQWQFGEFQGEDAASPAYVQIEARFSPVEAWRAGDGFQTYDGSAPLEALVQREALSPDFASAVELGQWFEALLDEAGLSTLVGPFRTAYPVPEPAAVGAAVEDLALHRFLDLCAGRAIDGLALLVDAQADPPILPADPALSSRRAELEPVLVAFREAVAETFGAFGVADAPGWQPDRLETQAQVRAVTPDGGRAVLDAYTGREGGFDWYAFDVAEARVSEDGGEEAEITSLSRSLLPIDVRFRGMPNARWWHFEDAVTDFGDVRADRREIAKVLLIDFMLVHGNDWLLVPFDQPVGSLCRVAAAKP